MAIVGAFARIESNIASSCQSALEEIAGVSIFDIKDPDKLGVLVEAESLNQAHSTITTTIRNTPGVLGVWPVYVNTEDEPVHD
ncbi:MAG: chaperone NapD [Phycisphaerales bacterium]|nr:chaperone NapD [Phycisphaerales bacterium]